MAWIDKNMHKIPNYEEFSDTEGELKEWYEAMQLQIKWLQNELDVQSGLWLDDRLELAEMRKAPHKYSF
jgi:hypothetical protein